MNKPNIKIRSVFDRRKSGYTREFNPLDVFFFNVMGFSLGLALVTNPTFIGGFAPSASLLIVIVLGALLAFFNGLIYGWFGAIMPSTGGDFIFVSRSLNHRLGFLTSWGFSFCQVYGFAMNIVMLISMSLIPSIETIGTAFNNSALIDFSANFTSGKALIAGIIIVFFYFLISLAGLNFNRVITILLFLIGILGPIIIFMTFNNTTHENFIEIFNTAMQKQNNNPNTYQTLISLANENGMILSQKTSFSESLRAMPIGFLCFLGFTYSVYIGGEVENPAKSQIRGILFALLLGVLTFVLCMNQYINIVGQEFNAAIGNPLLLEKVGLHSNSMNYIASFLITNKWLLLFMQLGILIWFLIVPYIMLQVCIRNLIAWTTDGLMPNIFLKRLPKTNSPWVASLIVVLTGALALTLIHFTGLSLVGAIALAAIAYLLTSVGAMILPTSNPNVFSKLPRSAKSKFLGFLESNFQVIGFLCVLGFLWIIYASIWYPEISGGTPIRALIMVISIYVGGLLFYQWRKNKLKQKEINSNVNIEQLFKEIPED